MITRRGRQAGIDVWPHRFRHHFAHTWPDRGGPEGDLMELNGWTSPHMLRRYGASSRAARARRTYDRIMQPAIAALCGACDRGAPYASHAAGGRPCRQPSELPYRSGQALVLFRSRLRFTGG
jgi:hypothetical protein